MRNCFYILIIMFCIACNEAGTEKGKREQAIKEIRQAEADFAAMAKSKGIMEAFEFYADSSGIIKRENDTLITGAKSIANYYSAPHYKTAAVDWAPDFVDASEDGTMGYTYGKYSWDFKDSTGKTETYKGIFHTVWKRQPDGSWKYVWD